MVLASLSFTPLTFLTTLTSPPEKFMPLNLLMTDRNIKRICSRIRTQNEAVTTRKMEKILKMPS